MHLTAAIVAVSGLVYSTTAFATPPVDMLGLVPRDSNYSTTNPCTLANSPAANASIQLASWFECQANGFFPYPANGAWDHAFAETFSPDVKATFNDTHYNYDGWLKLYHSFNTTLGRNFAVFNHGFINTLAVPNANGDKGGMVYSVGWEGGLTALKRDVYFTDAVFAVVKDVGGKRRIVEIRESSNIPNTAPLPETNEWTCKFTKEKGLPKFNN